MYDLILSILRIFCLIESENMHFTNSALTPLSESFEGDAKIGISGNSDELKEFCAIM